MANISNELRASKALVAELDASHRWEELAAKDVPADLLRYVAERISEVPLDTIRKELALGSPTDPRWRKIMTALKSGMRIDATGLFLKWLRRNDMLADRLAQILEKAFDQDQEEVVIGSGVHTQKVKRSPVSKTTVEMINAISNLQANSVKMGKELGVFADPQQNQGQGQQVTIVVTTNVPVPDREAIVVHQEKQRLRNQNLLDKHRPDEKK